MVEGNLVPESLGARVAVWRPGTTDGIVANTSLMADAAMGTSCDSS
jgi:hypothetical protein